MRGSGVTRQKSDRHGTVLRPHKTDTGEEMEREKSEMEVWVLQIGYRGQTPNGGSLRFVHDQTRNKQSLTT